MAKDQTLSVFCDEMGIKVLGAFALVDFEEKFKIATIDQLVAWFSDPANTWEKLVEETRLGK